MSSLRWLCIVALAFAVTGCIKVDQTLTLNKDGSGTLNMRYGMSEQAIAQVEAMEKMGEAMQESGGEALDMDAERPFDLDFDEAKVREEFEAEGLEGVELASVKSESVDGWRFMEMKLTFDNLTALKQTDYFDGSELSLSKDAEGNYVLTQRSTDNGDDGDDEEMDPQMLKQMAAMFAGMRIANRVIVPTEIIETNATDIDGRSASWVYDIEKDPTILSQIQNFNMRVVFSSEGTSIAMP
ncbi:hypothetical protein CKO42_05085 [Lamprobacter modestohalophilus]|uniref:Lipoprotein n=1 Tax=Lamprobacter modestohalophilus TaxID=1064514 RepID=A0A9X0W6Q3_9GAMM|nr:hypothetical protein [Lamprobacter modestohalophilus]MBK1617839.1 hypothetical protein [Lamprobacter modestohalophilus]MCF8005694.1 hypothetical protein [Chromatiaceae bacterium]